MTTSTDFLPTSVALMVSGEGGGGSTGGPVPKRPRENTVLSLSSNYDTSGTWGFILLSSMWSRSFISGSIHSC